MNNLNVTAQAQLTPAREVLRSVATIVEPPRRIKPSEHVHGRLRNDRDVLDLNAAPYLIEPLDCFADRRYQGIIFVGPARTGKTYGLAIAAIDYAVEIAPADILAIYMSQDTARDFSKDDLDKVIKNTPSLAAMLSPRPRDDNVYDKFFRNGVSLKIGWPSATQLRGKTRRYVLLMDIDGTNSGDIDGRGSMWGQARKRTETYMSRGKCLAESSPGFAYADPDWQPHTPHDVPPAKGITSLYLTGTRARWYWPCRHCGQHFQALPGLAPFMVPEDFEEIEEAVRSQDLMTLARSWAKVPCPHCGGIHEPADKTALNTARMDGDRIVGATWLHEGERLVDGRIEGNRRETDIASYWLGGVGAAYQPWLKIVHTYLAAVAQYVRTGDESEMRRSSFEDQAWPYLPMAIRRKHRGAPLEQRKEKWEPGTVPPGVRFLTAAIDVQKRRFIVQVQGWGPRLETWIVDRFVIFASDRREADGRVAPLNPPSFEEDWWIIEQQVIERAYKVPDVNAQLKPELVFCDSGGEEGVTDKAYAFWRRMRDKGLGQRFRLVKGTGHPTAARVAETWPDSRGRNDRSAGRGDVPVWLLNTNLIKDGVAADLARSEPGPGFVHVPEHVDAEYFTELQAEVRTAKGWENPQKKANHAFDLHAYNRAAVIVLGGEGINWESPPDWAADPAKRRSPVAAPSQSKGSSWLNTRRSFW